MLVVGKKVGGTNLVWMVILSTYYLSMYGSSICLLSIYILTIYICLPNIK